MYAIRNTATGQQYRPASRGYTDYLYATRYDAERAVRAMPPRWRDVYEVVEVVPRRRRSRRVGNGAAGFGH